MVLIGVVTAPVVSPFGSSSGHIYQTCAVQLAPVYMELVRSPSLAPIYRVQYFGSSTLIDNMCHAISTNCFRICCTGTLQL